MQGQIVNCLSWQPLSMYSCNLEITSSRLQFGNTSWLSKHLQKICAMQTSTSLAFLNEVLLCWIIVEGNYVAVTFPPVSYKPDAKNSCVNYGEDKGKRQAQTENGPSQLCQ